jgi:hypothetical protein
MNPEHDPDRERKPERDDQAGAIHDARLRA